MKLLLWSMKPAYRGTDAFWRKALPRGRAASLGGAGVTSLKSPDNRDRAVRAKHLCGKSRDECRKLSAPVRGAIISCPLPSLLCDRGGFIKNLCLPQISRHYSPLQCIYRYKIGAPEGDITPAREVLQLLLWRAALRHRETGNRFDWHSAALCAGAGDRPQSVAGRAGEPAGKAEWFIWRLKVP